jgi:hypothetical protein
MIAESSVDGIDERVNKGALIRPDLGERGGIGKRNAAVQDADRRYVLFIVERRSGLRADISLGSQSREILIGHDEDNCAAAKFQSFSESAEPERFGRGDDVVDQKANPLSARNWTGEECCLCGLWSPRLRSAGRRRLIGRGILPNRRSGAAFP